MSPTHCPIKLALFFPFFFWLLFLLCSFLSSVFLKAPEETLVFSSWQSTSGFFCFSSSVKVGPCVLILFRQIPDLVPRWSFHSFISTFSSSNCSTPVRENQLLSLGVALKSCSFSFSYSFSLPSTGGFFQFLQISVLRSRGAFYSLSSG